jgi:hypothetical protein
MADERIDGLPTTAGDVKTFLFIMDKNGELSAVQVPYADMLDAIEGDLNLSQYAVKTNVLELDNTTPFLPTGDNQPATKAYVDDRMFAGKKTGGVNYTGLQTVILNVTLPNTNYSAFVSIVSNGTNNRDNDYAPPVITNKTTSTFDFFLEKSTGETTDIDIDWAIIRY